MKTITKIAFCCCLSVFAVTAQAREFAGNGKAACVSEELYDQLISAAVDEDEQGFNYLLNHGCIIPRAGIKVSVLDRSWTGKTKVRAYVGDQAVVLWTVRDALRD